MKKVKTYEEELKETMEQLMELCKLGDEFVANHPPESFKVEPKEKTENDLDIKELAADLLATGVCF